MVYAYIRVSTGKQDKENQEYEINKFISKYDILIDEWIEETISGGADPSKRKLGKLLKKIKPNDLIICTEISRLGRSLFMIMDVLKICMEKQCGVWTIKDNFKLTDDIQTKVLAFAFGLSAEIERKLISQRTKEALERKKAEGVKLGRPKGALSKTTKLSGKEEAIRILIEEGTTYTHISELFHVDRTTIMRFCKSRGLKR